MKNAVVALLVGFLFALGLGISGMTQTQKVIGFLDIFGQILLADVMYRDLRGRKLG